MIGSSIGAEVAPDAALEAPERVAVLVLRAPGSAANPEFDEAAFNAATNGLADAIDAAGTAGELEVCNQLEVRLWPDGQPNQTGGE